MSDKRPQVSIPPAERLTKLVAGQKLHVQSFLAPPPWPDVETRLSMSADTLNGCLLMVQLLIADTSHVLGSAFLVGPGIALAARHVMEAHRDAGHFNHRDLQGIWLMGLKGGIGRVWSVDAYEFSPRSDFAILYLTFCGEKGADLVIDYFALCATLPRAGDRISAVGLRHGDGAQLPSIAIITSVGKVTDVYSTGRDAAMPQPCFAAELNTWGGMSGCPIFDEEGYVIGLLTSSMDPTEYHPIGISFCTQIWEALLSNVKPSWPSGFWAEGGGLLKDLLTVKNGDRLSVVETENGDRTWRYEE